ncbi:MAG: NADPH-quinone reductase [Alteromonadaceae bacterium]|nr:MAG: NADPH-quinone reductase [Alteromonadaceae bacterium]
MMKVSNYISNYLVQIVSCVCIALFSLQASAADAEQKITFSKTELAAGLYMLKGEGGFTGGNIALSIGDDGVYMVDDAMESMLGLLQSTIKTLTKENIDFLINTHVHFDHAGNNVSFAKAGAKIIAHEHMREHLVSKGMPTMDGPKPVTKEALPVITFHKNMTLHMNGQDARLIHLPHAHTNGDAAVHFKQANVIHMGDTFFNGMFPYIDLDSGGSIGGYIAAQRVVLNMCDDDTKIIPGHGPLATKMDLEKSLAMLLRSRSLIKTMIKAGKSEEEVVKANPLAEYDKDWSWNFISTEKMTRQTFKALSKNSGNKHNHHGHHNNGHKDHGHHGHSH